MFFVDFDVKHVNAGKLLEQHRLAFHHRLGRQRADVAQAQYGRAVGNDSDQVAPAGVFEGVVGVFDDFFARRGHTGRIGQCQVVLVDQLFGGRDRDLARCWELVVFERSLAQLGFFLKRVSVVVGYGGGFVLGHRASWCVGGAGTKKAGPGWAGEGADCRPRGFGPGGAGAGPRPGFTTPWFWPAPCGACFAYRSAQSRVAGRRRP